MNKYTYSVFIIMTDYLRLINNEQNAFTYIFMEDVTSKIKGRHLEGIFSCIIQKQKAEK